MIKTFIVSKKEMHFELHIDGVVEVRPLPNEAFSTETIKLLAEVHKTFIDWYRIKANHQGLVKVAVRYFEDRGYEVKEKVDGDIILPPPPESE